MALTEDGVLDGITPPLTARRTLDFADVAAILSRITGRTITRVVLDDDAWVSAAVAGEMPRPAAEFALTMFAAARNGEFDVTGPALENVIGRRAKSVEEVLEEAVRAW